MKTTKYIPDFKVRSVFGSKEPYSSDFKVRTAGKTANLRNKENNKNGKQRMKRTNWPSQLSSPKDRKVWNEPVS